MAPVLHLSGHVLVGPEEERDEAWVVGGRLTFERPTSPVQDVETLHGWFLPGLVDAHSHIGLDAQGATDEATAEEQLVTDRDAGTLLIRDAGSPADTRWVQERDDLPRLVRCGRHIARTRRYLRGVAWEVEPEQLVEQVRIEARAGDGWVKLVGDWIERDAGDLTPCWPREVLAEAVTAAHEEGARITAHCFGQESLYDMAAVGMDCVEHATGLEPETIAQFADQGIAIVPTLVNIETFPRIAEPAKEKFPAYHARMLDLHARRYETVGQAREAGIPVYLGTDAGGSLPHGLVVDELEQLVRSGMTRVQALDAGCWGARRWLGRPAFDEGATADVLVLDGDPRQDLGVLRQRTATLVGGLTV